MTNKLGLHALRWLLFVGAATLEVGGDAAIRKGLRGSGVIAVAIGGVLLTCYGILVNTVELDFSRLLGAYVAVFALVSVCWGRFVFREEISLSTWLGVIIIVAGGMIIQFGQIRLQ